LLFNFTDVVDDRGSSDIKPRHTLVGKGLLPMVQKLMWRLQIWLD